MQHLWTADYWSKMLKRHQQTEKAFRHKYHIAAKIYSNINQYHAGKHSIKNTVISSRLWSTHSKMEKKSRTSYSVELFNQPSNISTINKQEVYDFENHNSQHNSPAPYNIMIQLTNQCSQCKSPIHTKWYTPSERFLMMYRKQSSRSLISFWSSLSYRVTNDVAVIPVVEYPLHTFSKCIQQPLPTLTVSVQQAQPIFHTYKFGQVSQNFWDCQNVIFHRFSF